MAITHPAGRRAARTGTGNMRQLLTSALRLAAALSMWQVNRSRITLQHARTQALPPAVPAQPAAAPQPDAHAEPGSRSATHCLCAQPLVDWHRRV